VISKTLGRRMKKDEKNCLVTKESGKTVCKLGLVEEQQFCLTSAVARAAKDGGKECGDSYSFMELKNGQCILALSDGMGSGRKAMEESAAAIDLLEEFVETGFDKDTAVKMINSVLLLKFNDESFSTLDICSVDLYSGEAEFMKIGASSTFLVRNGEVSVIRSWSLPVGILNNVDLDITKKQLKDGDMLVMVTDGVLDAAGDDEDKDDWVADALRNMTAKNPQDVADLLISAAKAKSGGAANDDMTVLASRFWEK
jgi:stage II sporulation protein E